MEPQLPTPVKKLFTQTIGTKNMYVSMFPSNPTLGNLALGKWYLLFREKQAEEDDRLRSVRYNYEAPPAANPDTVEADRRIKAAKEEFETAIAQPDVDSRATLMKYLMKFGKLIGYTSELK